MKKNKIAIKFIFVIIILINVQSIFSQLVNIQSEYGALGLERSRDFYDQGLVRKAELELLEVLKTYQINPEADYSILLMTKIDLVDKNYLLALGRLDNFIKERPNSPLRAYASLMRAYILLEQKDFKNADFYLNETKLIAEKELATRKDTVYGSLAHNALYWRGVVLAQKGLHQEADSIFRECWNKYPNAGYADDALFSLGQIAEMNSRFGEAITYFELINRNYTYSNTIVAARIREANNRLIMREPQKALLVIENAESIIRHINANDSTGMLYQKQDFCENSAESLVYLKGEAYNLAGNFPRSIEIFKEFSGKNPNSMLINHVRFALGWALLNNREYEAAISQYNQIINSATNDKTQNIKDIAQLYRIIALKRNNESNQALKELTALTLQPGYPFIGHALLELGQIQYEMANFELAKRTLDRALRETIEAPVSVKVHLLLGAVYMELKSYEPAAKEFAAAEQLASISSEIFMPRKDYYISEARLKRGIALVESMRSSEAIPLLQKFLSENKKDKRCDEAMFWLAEAFYRSDLLKNSIETYSTLLNIYPETKRREEILYGLGWSYFRLKDFKLSSSTFEKLIAEFPKSDYGIEALTRQGDGYYLNKNYSSAADCYKKAKTLAPSTEEGQYSAYQLCHALYRLGKYEQSITSLLDFVRLYPRSSFSPNALYLIGWIRFQQKKYNEAIDGFKFLIQAYSQSTLVPRSYYAIGDAYYNMGRFNESIENYKFVIRNYPSDPLAPDAMKSIQYALMASGRDDEVISIIDSFTTMNPSSPFTSDFAFKKANLFYTGKKYADAISEYENFMKKYPDSEHNPEAIYWMAKSYISLNEAGKASELLTGIQTKFPKSDYAPVSMLENALLQKNTGNIRKSDSIFLNLQELYPEDQSAAQAGFERASIKYMLGDTAVAIHILKSVIRDYETSEFADQSLHLLGMYYRSKGMTDSAMFFLEDLATQDHNPTLAAEARYRIGEIWFRSGECDSAIAQFSIIKEKFAGFEDWFTLALLNMGECYEKLGKNDSAREVYQVIFGLRPDDDYGKTAKRRISRLPKDKEIQKEEGEKEIKSEEN